MKNFNKLELELEKLPFGKVLEITDLTKQEANNLFKRYNNTYVIRALHKETNFKSDYILYFELNPYKTRKK